MSILHHFKDLQLTNSQEKALQELGKFLVGEEQVFLLKGYAGTGKTTLIKGLVEFLKDKEKKFSVMAPTGRAAKILREKTGKGSTIHRSIYDFDRMEVKAAESEDVAEKSFHYYFPVSEAEDKELLAIIDESSMISDFEEKHEQFTFGTGKLLTDVLTYLKLKDNPSKVIFVGDPAQLPPVTDPKSKALSSDYFVEKGFQLKEIEMTDIIRQEDKSEILSIAKQVRETLNVPRKNRNTLRLNPAEKEVFELKAGNVVKTYLDYFPHPEVGNGVIINFSNASALNYNLAIREQLFPDNKEIVPGDVVVVNNNNYHTYGVEILNGDMAQVTEVSDKLVHQTAPVWVPAGDKKVKKHITLSYRDIKLKFPHYADEIQCKIVDSLLNSPERDLTITERRSQYINFVMRFNEEQKKNKEKGLPAAKEGSEEFKMQLKNDPYFNALRVKYGYALTCHKSQGGEWDKVFVDFSGRHGLDNEKLQWIYTAITRASKQLFLINYPRITPFDKLKFNDIIKVSKAPKDFYPQKRAFPTPYHSLEGQTSKRLKYYEISEAIKNTPFQIESVDSKPYQEIYHFSHGEQKIRLDFYHSGGGIFNDMWPGEDETLENSLKKIIHEAPAWEIEPEYEPSTDFLSKLYSRVSMAAEASGCTIVIVIEQIPKNYVMYYFKSSGKFSLIQFYFKSNGMISTAMPKSDLGADDDKLRQLISKLNNNGIPGSQ